MTLRYSWTGKEALEAVLGGKADFSAVAETPVMFAAFRNELTIADSDRYMKIIARKDRKIEVPRGLKGKRIGVSLGTNAEYFLDAYLSFYAISHDDFTTVPMKTEAMAVAFARGIIDAAVTWEPHRANPRKRMPRNAVVFENELVYQISWNMAAGRGYVANHPGTVVNLLRALIGEQDYITARVRDAAAVTAAFVGKAEFDLADFNFDVRLGQSLVLDLEEQARWAIRRGLTDKKRCRTS